MSKNQTSHPISDSSESSSKNGSFGKDGIPATTVAATNITSANPDSFVHVPAPPPPSPPLATHQVVGTYTADEATFHRVFPSIPLSEKIVDQYQCSVMRNKVVRLGKLYLTNTRLCFTSTFIRDPVNLPWEAVASVQRRTNFLFDSIVLKRTKEAMEVQRQAEQNGSHPPKRTASQGLDMSGTTTSAMSAEGDSTEVRKSSPSASFQAGASNGSLGSHPNSSFATNENGHTNEQMFGSGGVGEEEVLTGFISGSSDQALRMIQMLWSVRVRYTQQEKEAAAARKQQQQLDAATSVGERTPPIAPTYPPPTSDPATSPRSTTPNSPSPTNTATNEVAPAPLESPPSSFTLKATTTKGDKTAATDSEVVASAGVVKTSSKSVGSYISSGLRTSLSAVSSVMPSSGTSSKSKHKKTKEVEEEIHDENSPNTGGDPLAATLASPTDEDGNPRYVRHQSDDEHDDTARRRSFSKADASEEMDPLDGNDDGTDEPGSPSVIPQPLSPLQQATTNAAGDVNAHRYTALLLKSFPIVPKNEVVIESFQCSFVAGVHRLGRLYVTSNYLLFSSPFMSEGLVIRLVDVASISRWQTMKVLDGLSVEIRPDAAAVTSTQIFQAGGILPAVAINNSRVMAGSNSAAGLKPTASTANLDAPTTEDDKGSNVASPTDPTTEVAEGKSRSSSVLVRQDTQSPTNKSVAYDDGDATPPRTASPSRRPQSMYVGGAGISTQSPSTNNDPVYTKTSFAFTSFVGSRDEALKLIRHLHAPHYIRAEEAADAVKDVVSQVQQKQAAAAAAAVPGSPTASTMGAASTASLAGSPTAPSLPSTPAVGNAGTPSMTTSTPVTSIADPASIARAPNDPAIYITANKLEECFTALKTDYGTDLSPISNFFGGDSSKKLLSEQPVYFPQGVGLVDIFRDTFTDDTSTLDQYHAERKDTNMSWTKWARIANCEGHTAITTQLAELPADAMSDIVGASEFLPPFKAGQRCLKCKTIVKAVGSTVCDFTEYQKYAFIKVPSSDQYGAGGTLGGYPAPPSAKADGNRRLLVMQISGQAVGAMFSDTFRAETVIIFEEELVGGSSPSSASFHPLSAAVSSGNAAASTAAPANVRVSMVCYGHIQFVKSVWGIKGKIISAALGVEMPECYRNLFHNQMKPLALKLIQDRKKHSPQPTNTPSASTALAVASASEGVPSGAVEVTSLSDLKAEPQTTVASDSAGDAGVSTYGQPNQVRHQGVVGGGGVSLRAALSPSQLFPFADFPSPSSQDFHYTTLHKGLLIAVAIVAFFVAWWSAWGILSCLFWGVEVTRPSIPSEPSVGADAASLLTASGQAISSSEMYALANVHAAIFNTYVRPLFGCIYGTTLVLAGSVLTEYVLLLLK